MQSRFVIHRAARSGARAGAGRPIGARCRSAGFFVFAFAVAVLAVGAVVAEVGGAFDAPRPASAAADRTVVAGDGPAEVRKPVAVNAAAARAAARDAKRSDPAQ